VTHIIQGTEPAAVDWTCPYCGRHSTVTKERTKLHQNLLDVENVNGPLILSARFTVCPNTACKQVSLKAWLNKAELLLPSFPPTHSGYRSGALLHAWQLLPGPKAREFPDYIPKAILDDYAEAYLIVHTSPKASATLSRRCLQGMLRDFWAVKPTRLYDEINQIKDRVDPQTWDAIEAVRKVGNIGAHMEADISIIVDVEPHEAEVLVELIETLLGDWYVDREERRRRLIKVKEIGEAKSTAPKNPTPSEN